MAGRGPTASAQWAPQENRFEVLLILDVLVSLDDIVRLVIFHVISTSL
tara:strand:- start:290 stop:433 length:144 start_codon:yes stop_codon:yes gene_type:complete